MAFIEIDNKKIHIEEHGQKNRQTIVYFHGGPGASCLDFTNQAKTLGEKYHIVSFDQYGVMRSDAIIGDKPFGMVDHIKLIDKMRKIMKINTWTILGHSYGGMLACLYAYTYPDNVETVIYDCPSWNYVLSAKSVASHFLPYFQRLQSTEGQSNCYRIICKDYYGNNKSEVFEDLLSVLSLVKDEKERNYLHSISIDEYRESMPQQGIPEDGWEKSNVHFQKLVDAGEIFNNYLPYLTEIQKPSLLLVGKYDPACGKDQRDYYKNYSFSSTVVEFENSGHFPRIEEAQLYKKSIVDFLKCVRQKGEVL